MPTTQETNILQGIEHPAKRLAGGLGHLAQLDGLRALAVIAVAWSHWGTIRYTFGLPWGTGVQLFFVLSGFLITGILLDAKAAEPTQDVSGRFAIWRSFYARRFLRIFPLYYAVLAVTFLLQVGPIDHAWKWHISYLSNFFFVRQGGWSNPPDSFGHFWSLAVEEQFYLVWPFLILLLSNRTLLKILIGIILIAPAFRIAMYWMGINREMIHLLPFSCMDSLGIGGLFAYAMRHPIGTRWQTERLSKLCLWLGLPACLGFALLERSLDRSFVAHSLGHFGLMLFYGWIVCKAATGFRGFVGSFLQARPIAYLGKISYGLYVFHNFAAAAVLALASKIGLGKTLAASLPLTILSNALFTMILAMASWHLYEAPINRLKRYFPYTSKAKASKPGNASALKSYRWLRSANHNQTSQRCSAKATIKRRYLHRKRLLMEFGVRPYLLPSKVEHICGPQHVSYSLEELLVISVVRNGELYIRSFLDHYRAMGVRHFVFLDNESTDRTVEMLCAHEDVTVLQTNAPYQKYENTMKRYLAERFSPGRWNLCADIDELFDYPFSESLRLAAFLQYLNTNRYTAVVAQMLDMFSDIPLNKLESKTDDILKEKYVYYDISDIEREDYLWSKRSNPAIKMHWGGIRKRVFGTINGLTKSPLVFMDGKVKPFITWHHPKGARMADISCLLMHYPFVSSFCAKVEDAAGTGRYGFRVTDEYRAYLKGLQDNPNLSFKLESAQRFNELERLIEDRFIIVSDKYRRWVNNHFRQHCTLSTG